jgi:hypothetical protein
VTEKCEEYNKNVYSPKDLIHFKEINWTYSNVRRFDSGTVSLENNTLDDINYIKFRLILKRGQYWWDAEPFFNQTVESNKTIYKGDLATVDVPGMSDYYTGFNINNEDIFLDAELIEVGPKPISIWCKTLNELKDENRKE